jgi:hypothetical protein
MRAIVVFFSVIPAKAGIHRWDEKGGVRLATDMDPSFRWDDDFLNSL